MRKAYLITAILLLSAVWVVAQTGSSTSPSSQTPSTSSSSSSTQSTSPSSSYPQSSSPSSSSPSSQTPDTSSSTTTTQTTQTTSSSDSNAQTIEGCLAGSAGNFTLTDQSGKSYQLAGDTSKLSDHVGHQVQITGSEAAGSSSSSSPSSSASSSTGAGAAGAGASSGQSTFNVKKVKMISSSCPSGASK